MNMNYLIFRHSKDRPEIYDRFHDMKSGGICIAGK